MQNGLDIMSDHQCTTKLKNYFNILILSLTEYSEDSE